MDTIFTMFGGVFAQCVEWTNQLLVATGAKDYILAGFIIFLVCGLFLVPLRGISLRGDITTADFGTYTAQKTYEKKGSLAVRRSGGLKER